MRSRKIRRLSAAIVALACCTVESLALSDDRSGATAAASSSAASDANSQANAEKCRALAERARRRALAEDYLGAALLYREAYSTFRNADVLFMLGASEVKAGLSVDALSHFRAYLIDPDSTAERRALAERQLIPQAYAATAHVNLEFSPLAPLYVDGKALTTLYSVPRTGPETRTADEIFEGSVNVQMIDLSPGAHELVGVSKGRRTQWRAVIDVKAGETVTPRFIASDIPSSHGASSSTGKR